jgi:hypothetical protein
MIEAVQVRVDVVCRCAVAPLVALWLDIKPGKSRRSDDTPDAAHRQHDPVADFYERLGKK